MNVFRKLCLVGLVALVLGLASSQAHAQQAWGGGFGYGYGMPYNLYGMEHIPYYSLYPPVYYSYPVPRTYGYSPFAYPPGTMTPDVPAAEPKLMLNPFVPRRQTEQPAKDQTASQPLRIRNPFVDGNSAQEPAQVSLREERPKVIHPAGAFSK